MTATLFVVAIVLTQVAVPVRTAEEICEPPQARRCDAAGRVLSVCSAGGVWAEEADCAATGEVCVRGRCASPNATRATRVAESCQSGKAAGDPQCTADCSAIGYCNDFGKVAVTQRCAEGYQCDPSTYTCQLETTGTCAAPHLLKCVESGIYPDMRPGNCNLYYLCHELDNGGLIAWWYTCGASGIYNASTELCSTTSTCSAYAGCDTGYYDNVLHANPAYHYFCYNNQIIWQKCESGYYVPELAECVKVKDNV